MALYRWYGLASGILLSLASLAQAQSHRDVQTQADHAFDRLSQQAGETRSGLYPPDRYWIGTGQGDLSKGRLVCRRVSELSARTDLAKQIRVMVKEHMVDRMRERSGKEPEQDIELIREELVQEYLQDVKIVDHRVDEVNQICTATAVMPKTAAVPRQAPPERSASDGAR